MNMMNPAAGDNQDSYQTLFFVSNRVDGTHNAGRGLIFETKNRAIFSGDSEGLRTVTGGIFRGIVNQLRHLNRS